MSAPQHFIVSIEFKRLQSFIFEVPRLRAMVGANTLVGETIRLKLPQLARRHGTCHIDSYPSRIDSDPIEPRSVAAKSTFLVHDDPLAAAQQGVISRDGGHLHAVFNGEASAGKFACAAEALLCDKLPGLQFVIQIIALENEQPKSLYRVSQQQQVLPEMPFLQLCEESGKGTATRENDVGGEKKSRISAATYARYYAGKRFSKKWAFDLVSELYRSCGWYEYTVPKDFQALCEIVAVDNKRARTGYMAVIHADGNDIGKLAVLSEEEQSKSYFEREALIESRYHKVRVKVREAVKAAVAAVFLVDADLPSQKKRLPFQILMLGGDDLLLVCRADLALRFVQAFATALDTDKSMSVGVGVAIARHTVPFHQLHAQAEALASSAKRMLRATPKDKPKVSAVDYAISTDSAMEDPITCRKARSFVRQAGAEIALSAKPYNILGSANSLQALLKAADDLPPAALARSQRRELVLALALGPLQGQLAYEELPEEARNALNPLGLGTPWHASDHGKYLSALPDLSEILEIKTLGGQVR